MSKVVFNINFTAAKPKRNANIVEEASWRRERAFYNLTAKYNYLSYSLNGKKTAKNKDILNYMQKDTGAFNLDGALSDEDLKKIRNNLAVTKSNIWHGWISFDEEVSKGIKTPEQAIKFLRHNFYGNLIEKSHLNPRNIELMASLHVDTKNHHHIHFSFWEREPMYLKANGEKEYTSKGTFKQDCIDNYLISTNLYLDEYQDDYHIARDRALARLKELMPTRTNKGQCKEDIGYKLAELAKKLPESGRLGYNSKNMDNVRNVVDKTVDYIVNRDAKLYNYVLGAYNEIDKRKERAMELANENQMFWMNGRRIKPERVQNIDGIQSNRYGVQSFDCVDKLKDSLREKLGNQIIKGAICMKNSFNANLQKNAKAGKNAARRTARMNRVSIEKNVRIFLSEIESLTQHNDFSYKLHIAEREIENNRAQMR